MAEFCAPWMNRPQPSSFPIGMSAWPNRWCIASNCGAEVVVVGCVAAGPGVAVGVASDEPECREVDPVKRERLIGVGADWIVPNFSGHDELMTAMFGD